jgi:hypothetical protein
MSAQTILDRLALVLTPEKLQKLSALDEDMLQPILDAHSEQIAEAEKAIDLKAERKKFVTKAVSDTEELSAEDTAKYQAQLKAMPMPIRLHTDKAIGKVKFALDGGLLQLRVSVPHLIPKILDLIQSEIDEAGEEFDKAHKPKPKKKTSGKRERNDNWAEDCLIKTNTEATAQGKDYPYYFNGDETCVMLKDGKIGEKDGKKVKRQTYRAVRKETPFMPKVDGGCCGAINWDRSVGSDALADFGIKKGQFRMLCGEKATTDGFCAKCAKKGENFWKGKYKNGNAYHYEIFTNSNGCEFNADELRAMVDLHNQ